jgi:AbrB family looped-hinge helix DNA binding protein
LWHKLKKMAYFGKLTEKGRIMTIQVNITANGRMSLPADLRKRLGLSGGGALLLEETPDGVILRTVAQSIAHARALARKYTANKPEASVDVFLGNRRAESGE